MKKTRLTLEPEFEPIKEIPLHLGPEHGPISMEHSLEVFNSLVAYLANEMDPEAFFPKNYMADLRYADPGLRLMLERRKAALSKATSVVKTIMATLDKEYVLFYEGKFTQS